MGNIYARSSAFVCFLLENMSENSRYILVSNEGVRRVGNNPACPSLGEVIDSTKLPYDVLAQWKALKAVADLLDYSPAINVTTSRDYHDFVGQVRTFSDLEVVVGSECSIGGIRGLEAVFVLKAKTVEALKTQLQITPPGVNFSAIEMAISWASEPTLKEVPAQVTERGGSLPSGELTRKSASVVFVETCVKNLYPGEKSGRRIDVALDKIRDIDEVGSALEGVLGLQAVRTIAEKARQKASESVVISNEDRIAKRVLRWVEEEMPRIEEAERLAEQKKRLEALQAKINGPWTRKTKSGLPRGYDSYTKKKKRQQ